MIRSNVFKGNNEVFLTTWTVNIFNMMAVYAKKRFTPNWRYAKHWESRQLPSSHIRKLGEKSQRFTEAKIYPGWIRFRQIVWLAKSLKFKIIIHFVWYVWYKVALFVNSNVTCKIQFKLRWIHTPTLVIREWGNIFSWNVKWLDFSRESWFH